MSNRLFLHEELCDLLGSRNVYFQPPEDLQMKYPCIVYSRNANKIWNADDERYHSHENYDITVIDADPDSVIPDLVEQRFRYCRIDRYYVSDHLNHASLVLHLVGRFKENLVGYGRVDYMIVMNKED